MTITACSDGDPSHKETEDTLFLSIDDNEIAEESLEKIDHLRQSAVNILNRQNSEETP